MDFRLKRDGLRIKTGSIPGILFSSVATCWRGGGTGAAQCSSPCMKRHVNVSDTAQAWPASDDRHHVSTLLLSADVGPPPSVRKGGARPPLHSQRPITAISGLRSRPTYIHSPGRFAAAATLLYPIRSGNSAADPPQTQPLSGAGAGPIPQSRCVYWTGCARCRSSRTSAPLCLCSACIQDMSMYRSAEVQQSVDHDRRRVHRWLVWIGSVVSSQHPLELLSALGGMIFSLCDRAFFVVPLCQQNDRSEIPSAGCNRYRFLQRSWVLTSEHGSKYM